MDRVEAVPVVINGQAGYDIRVADPGATVQDYLDAVNRFIEAAQCYRARKPEADSCFACDLCCQERIPVTLIDALNMAEGDLGRFVGEMLHVYVEGRVVDITMGLNEAGKCLCLDSSRGLCRNYGKRPLVCQTFICCPLTRDARKLREEIVNAGEDELVRKWFKIKTWNNNLIIHEAVSPRPDPGDYPRTPFAGAVSYRQVRLKDVCTPRLWKRITEKKEVF